MCVCVLCACVCLHNMRHTAPTAQQFTHDVMRFRLVPLHALQTRTAEITEHFVFQAFV